MTKKVSNTIYILILIFSIVLIIGSIYYKKNYAEQSFDTLLYHVSVGTTNANMEVVWKGIKVCIIPVMVVLIIIIIPITSLGKSSFFLEIQFKSKTKSLQVYPNPKIIKYRKFYSGIICFLSVILFFENIGIYEYMKNQSQRTKIFEEEYVETENVSIIFPEKKRNLIYIFLESMETTVASRETGGAWQYSIIPELEGLAQKNINFSNTEKIGGAYQLPGTGWTIAGMVSQTSGVPLKINIGPNDYKNYNSFLPGIYSLGDILKKEGYNMKLMVGSDSGFGGRKEYFTSHGNYEIFDVYTALKEGKMTEEDSVYWGYDDDDLFKWAKDEILELVEQDQPFNFVMLTVDTHSPDGYLSENAGNQFETQYENVFAYSSKSVSKFVEWIKKQDFYENTTIVIVGDHLGMQTEFYKTHIEEDYTRIVYNTFINSAIPESNSKNREFSTLDIFPTVLASIGAEIEGERLGLGTNLFSGKETLIEKYGFEYVNNELSKKSNYYNQKILKDDYIEMLNNVEE